MDPFLAEYGFVIASVVAGVLASLACGLGALPLLIPGIDFTSRIGLGYGFAGGLMFAASVYNLLLPALGLGREEASALGTVLQTLLGMGLGCAFLWAVERFLLRGRTDSPLVQLLGGRVSALVFLAMTCHSIPEGVAVGVGFASEEHFAAAEDFGLYISLAIGIHNIPEGLAVALPMRAHGASVARCFFFAFLTSLPQPIAAFPASLLVWLFEPLMLPFLGFAAGAMMYLVIVELIPDALEKRTRAEIAWSFMAGFGLMALVQVGF
jgi:ZIP family zinc transporter